MPSPIAMSPELKDKIVKKMFADAEELGWSYLTGDQRSAIYSRWMDDPEVGGRLRDFLSDEKARVWIKESPMKEYARARYGVGGYAKYVANPLAGAEDLVERAMGPSWEIVPGKRDIKPLRVRVRCGEEERHFTWAPSEQLKHLVWAAIKAEVFGDVTPWVLCVVSSFEKPIPADEQETNRKIGARCRLEIVHVDAL
ncbi:hypothetical protein Aple_042590 [Acrocarpospora pleiomorpha]|uniref:Uncharacterized protein n=1 Tax=Acrocarpospora pleiomorpha TaxID=90975 RepID=A0A5M3XQA3_9ACTN|nr:hypothetical protein [Acrocarpospora pleiomorpha]GES21363.1 hypothetical protein Aple_042590 [Acrocarpospora pleiomorpha]